MFCDLIFYLKSVFNFHLSGFFIDAEGNPFEPQSHLVGTYSLWKLGQSVIQLYTTENRVSCHVQAFLHIHLAIPAKNIDPVAADIPKYI
jgi:hypothetical protein